MCNDWGLFGLLSKLRVCTCSKGRSAAYGDEQHQKIHHDFLPEK
jgi:hypothetical protein